MHSYGDYPDLCSLLHKYIKPTDHTLLIGANNSSIGESLYDVGYHSLVNVDPSESSIKKATSKNKDKRPDMTFDTMDFSKVKVTVEGFHVTSYQANFASHHTGNHHVGFLFPQHGIGKYNKLSCYLLFYSSIPPYQIKTEHDKNINTHLGEILSPSMNEIESLSVFCCFSLYYIVQKGNQETWQNGAHIHSKTPIPSVTY